MDQRPDPNRYALIPRTISFVTRKNEILLIKLTSGRGPWPGQYNGIGGHIELGEDPLSAARREVREETGLTLEDQRLCGVVTIDTGGTPGIGLFVFVGETMDGDFDSGPEGTPEFIALDRLDEHKLVEDLDFLIPQALRAHSEKTVFFAAYSYDSERNLQIALAE